MRRVFVFVPLLLLCLAPLARAQYGGDPSSGYIDQMVRDHINQRRTEETRRASSQGRGRRHSSKAVKARRAAGKPAPITGELSLAQDMFSPFGTEDKRGFTLQVRLTPAGGAGKPLTRWARFSPSDGERSVRLTNVPPGRYRVSVQVIDAGHAAIPALLGTECGEPSTPNGGNFAASQLASLTPGKDAYGNRAVRQSSSLWFRPRVSP